MTTYPLSEPATIYDAAVSDDATSTGLGRGTLEACVDIIVGLPPEKRKSVGIQMDDLELKFGPHEVGELIEFLREEDAGLSNNEITEIKSSDA